MNLTQVLTESYRTCKDKAAIVFEGRTYPFREIDEEIGKRAVWAKKSGLKKGDRIAIQLPKGT